MRKEIKIIHKNYILIFALIFSAWIIPCLSFAAAPSISSINSSNLNNGAQITVNGSNFGLVRAADNWDTFDDYSSNWSCGISPTDYPCSVKFPSTGSLWSNDGGWTAGIFQGDAASETLINGKPLLHLDSSSSQYSTGRGFTQTLEYENNSTNGAQGDSGIWWQYPPASDELYAVYYFKYDPKWAYPWLPQVEKHIDIWMSDWTKMVIILNPNEHEVGNKFSPYNARFYPIVGAIGGDSSTIDTPTADGAFPVPGTWNEMKFYFKLNTPGKVDGIVQMWLNGKQFLNDNTVDFRGNSTKTFGTQERYVTFFDNIQAGGTGVFTAPGPGNEWDRSLGDIWLWRTNQPQLNNQFPLIPVLYLSNQSSWGTGPSDKLNGDSNFVRQVVGGTANADLGFKSWSDNSFKFIINKGNLNISQPIYMYVTNWAGQTNSAGFLLSSALSSDIQSPSVPANLTATAISSNQINLSWLASADNVGVTGYKIYRNGSQIATTANTTYSDTNLSPSTSYSYVISAYDAAGNASAQSASASVTTQALADTTPPVLSNGQPVGTLSSGTTQTTISLSTNETAVCKYSTAPNTSYSSMAGVFTSTNSKSHSTIVSNLSDGRSYTYYIRCQNSSGNADISDYLVSFSVSSQSAPAVSSSAIIISPSADTFINLNANNYSTSTQLNTYTWPDNKIANAILMKFNLSSIPQNSVINSANLNLYLTQSDSLAGSSYTIPVYKIINKNPDLSKTTGYTYDGVNGWTSSNCCYSNVPLAQSDISSAYGSDSVDKTNGFKSWNITSLVQDWINNPSSNYGLLLGSDPSQLKDAYRFFASSRSSIFSQRPYLEINYTLQQTTGSVTVPTASTSISDILISPALEKNSDINNSSFTVSIYRPNETNPLYTAAVTPVNNSISIPSMPVSAGLYDIKLSSPRYLSERLSNVALNSSSSVIMPALLAGDLNQDNIINSLDYSILSQKWFQVDSVSDINHDGIVNSIDFSILNKNWLKTGD